VPTATFYTATGFLSAPFAPVIAGFAISGLIRSGRMCSSQGLDGLPQPGVDKILPLAGADDRDVPGIEETIQRFEPGSLPRA
jgi:hypothetical protein